MLFLAMAAFGIATVPAIQAQAADHQPIVVVSLSGYAEILKDIDFLGDLGNKPDMANTLEAILNLFTAQKGLDGLDKERPWGLAITTHDGQMPIFGFLPVTDLEKLFDALAGFVADPEE